MESAEGSAGTAVEKRSDDRGGSLSATTNEKENPLRNFVRVVLAAAVATISLLTLGAGTAFASPCASGERLVGSTDTAWLCENIDTGSVREVLKV